LTEIEGNQNGEFQRGQPPGFSLTFSAGGQLSFQREEKLFELNFFMRKTFL